MKTTVLPSRPKGEASSGSWTIALVVLAAGCQPTVTVDDDVDVVWDFVELLGPSSVLHTPYAEGASMTFYVHSTDDNEKMEGWTVESSDTSIFTFEAAQRAQDHPLYFVGHAIGDGTAALIVRDSSGSVVLHQPVESRLPDRAQLMSHALLILGRSEQEAQVTDVRTLAGGTSTFLVRYYLGQRTLYGNGALGVDAPPNVVASTPKTYLFEDRDWLQVTPNASGTSTLALKVNGNHFSDVPLEAVSDTQIQSLSIIGNDESHAQKGQWLVALGQAFDAQMRHIWGVDFTWDVDGQAQSGWYGNAGDLYRYKFDPTRPSMLAASYNGMAAVAMIHSGGGYVDSSNHIGCSAMPGSPRAPLPIALLLLLAVLLRRGFSL
jgi:hypothetical protein